LDAVHEAGDEGGKLGNGGMCEEIGADGAKGGLGLAKGGGEGLAADGEFVLGVFLFDAEQGEGGEVAEARHGRKRGRGGGAESSGGSEEGGDARAGTFDSAQGAVALLAPARWCRAAMRAATPVWSAATSCPRAQRRGDFAFLCGSSRLCGANSGRALCRRVRIGDRNYTAATGRGAEARRFFRV